MAYHDLLVWYLLYS